jgi:hypothetical protein
VRHSRLRTHAKCLALQGTICTPNSISQLCGWAHEDQRTRRNTSTRLG